MAKQIAHPLFLSKNLLQDAKESALLASGIVCRIVHYTPAMALAVLEASCDSNPRPVSQSHVDAIAAEIKAGGFMFNGEPIIFDEKGRLIDGQHRLRAIVQAGIGVDLLEVRGVPNKVKDTIDIVSRRRSFGDILAGRGHTGSRDFAAVGRAAHSYLELGHRSPSSFTKHSWEGGDPLAIVAWIERYGKTIHRVLNGMTSNQRRAFQSATAVRLPAVIAAVAAERELGESGAEVYIDAAVDYVHGLGKITGLGEGDPRNALIQYSVRTKTRVNPGVYAVVCAHTWNAWIEGRKIAKVMWKSNPEGFLEYHVTLPHKEDMP